jgi:hypothetical protein
MLLSSLVFAYTQPPGGQSLLNFSARLSIARQLALVGVVTMETDCWGTSGVNGGSGISLVAVFPSFLPRSLDPFACLSLAFGA